MVKSDEKISRTKKLLKAFHSCVIGNYPFLKKWFILYPFFAFYKILKYGFLVVIGKRNGICKLKKSAKRRERLIEFIEKT